MAGFLSGIIGLTIALIVTVNVLLFTVHNTSTTGWSTGEAALFSSMGLIIVAGLVYAGASVFGLT